MLDANFCIRKVTSNAKNCADPITAAVLEWRRRQADMADNAGIPLLCRNVSVYLLCVANSSECYNTKYAFANGILPLKLVETILPKLGKPIILNANDDAIIPKIL